MDFRLAQFANFLLSASCFNCVQLPLWATVVAYLVEEEKFLSQIYPHKLHFFSGL
jgi:hypothetical protein